MKTIGLFFAFLALLMVSCQKDTHQLILTEPRMLVQECRFTEGPSVDSRGVLYFSDGPNNRIMRLTPDGEISVHLQPSGRANGTAVDHEDRLVMCQSHGEGGGRRIARLEHDGTITVLADSFRGAPFIGPNDLTIDRKGRIYFTDPYYGPPAEKSQPVSGVYRIDRPGQVVMVIDSLQRPNGIILTPDNKALYVSDRGTQRLHRYRVLENGDLEHERIVYDFSPDRGIDGMALDVQGHIYGAAGKDSTSGVYVLSPQGDLLQIVKVEGLATNVTFGGPDRKQLFLTAESRLYGFTTHFQGIELPVTKK
ncbi:SMP-30/gluconolactonase/LRE family protein [candidate division KSB1 bacterium]|nr:SMP-30/gluconolactonase/LRE family protein [candidate division KSB1 bacterium]